MKRVLALACAAALLAGCQLAPRAADAPRESQIKPTSADFDGDGRPDEAHVGHWRTGTWLIVDLATGQRDKLLLTRLPTYTGGPPACVGSAICQLAGVPDFDRDGRHELAVQLDSGAYVATVGVFRADRRGIRRLGLAGTDRPVRPSRRGVGSSGPHVPLPTGPRRRRCRLGERHRRAAPLGGYRAHLPVRRRSVRVPLQA